MYSKLCGYTLHRGLDGNGLTDNNIRSLISYLNSITENNINIGDISSKPYHYSSHNMREKCNASHKTPQITTKSRNKCNLKHAVLRMLFKIRRLLIHLGWWDFNAKDVSIYGNIKVKFRNLLFADDETSGKARKKPEKITVPKNIKATMEGSRQDPHTFSTTSFVANCFTLIKNHVRISTHFRI